MTVLYLNLKCERSCRSEDPLEEVKILRTKLFTVKKSLVPDCNSLAYRKGEKLPKKTAVDAIKLTMVERYHSANEHLNLLLRF